MTLSLCLKALCLRVRRLRPAESIERMHTHGSLLVDVREPKEWQKGVVQSAALVPLTDLWRSGPRWRTFMQTVGDRELILYCGAGVRAHFAARLLCAQGFRALNGGGISEWAKAGFPIVPASSMTAAGV